MDPEAFDDMFDDDAKGAIIDKASNWSGEMESGKAVNLLPGEDIVTTTPGRPNPEFDPFWAAIVRQIGMALELPYEVLVMHFQSSYSASRAALLMAWKGFRTRRDTLATYLCQPVFELWLADEVAEGRIHALGFFASELVRAAWCAAVWTGDGPGSIDPEKEVNAAVKRVDAGISTKEAESIAYDGIPWRTKHDQRVREVNAEKAASIYFPPAGTPAIAARPDAASTPAPSND
jgi:capsid protein